MLLERFGLWEVRNERVSTFSRGMVQRLALCRVFLHEPALLLLDEPFSALDAQGAELLERELAERARAATFLVATHEPERRRAARDRATGVRVRQYVGDVAALARKDLLLELRARDTLPAMLLFVAAALVIFHFALPSGTGELAGLGLLWVAIIFTALLGLSRAFVAEREEQAARRARARAVRPQRDLARQVARRARVPRAGRGDRAAAVRALLLERRLDDGRGGRARGRRHLRGRTLARAMAIATRARELLLPLLFLPLAIPVIVGGVGASVADAPAATLASSRSTTRSLRLLGVFRVRGYGVTAPAIDATWRCSVPQQPPKTLRAGSRGLSSR